MSRATARAVMNGQVSEREFQAAVVRYAELRGWRVFHVYDSRRSAAGFPDLVLARNGRLVFAELKTEKGRATTAQNEWLDEFEKASLVNARVDAYLWKPSSWPIIEVALR